MNHIELFAGCGGLSLGLETAGFSLLLANELSPMASETFSHNHLNVNLENHDNIDNVFWVSSQYPRSNIQARLRENPYEATGLKDKYSDLLQLKPTAEKLKRSLLVGSIVDINSILNNDDPWLLDTLQNGLGQGCVDLVSGGPPCQSFSLAGMRDHTNHRNKLPWEFVCFVDKVRPKIALLENVTGILRAFEIEGKKFYAWFEVAKAFAEIGYVPLCLHVNAKYVGTAQNRPRFILIAIRLDIYESISENTDDEVLLDVLKSSRAFFNDVHDGNDPKYGAIECFDLDKKRDFFDGSVFDFLKTHNLETVVSVEDAIDDLRANEIAESEYVKHINSTFDNFNRHDLDKWVNHKERNNNNKVRARFRLYQIMSRMDSTDSVVISKYLRTEGLSGISPELLTRISKFWVLDTQGEKIQYPTENEILGILDLLYTKKQTQKALVGHMPAPAALSIPDDACHYHESVDTLRTLTVREMARIQSFPDWFEIKSKVTTGGVMRRYEVPQYTQVGNAVPPLLGLALGKLCRELIKFSKI